MVYVRVHGSVCACVHGCLCGVQLWMCVCVCVWCANVCACCVMCVCVCQCVPCVVLCYVVCCVGLCCGGELATQWRYNTSQCLLFMHDTTNVHHSWCSRVWSANEEQSYNYWKQQLWPSVFGSSPLLAASTLPRISFSFTLNAAICSLPFPACAHCHPPSPLPHVPRPLPTLTPSLPPPSQHVFLVTSLQSLSKVQNLFPTELWSLAGQQVSSMYTRYMKRVKVKTTTYGLKSWRYSAAKLCNSMPDPIRSLDNYKSFKKQLRKLNLIGIN